VFAGKKAVDEMDVWSDLPNFHRLSRTLKHMRVQFYLRKTITQMSKYTKATYNKPNEFRKQKRKVYAAI